MKVTGQGTWGSNHREEAIKGGKPTQTEIGESEIIVIKNEDLLTYMIYMCKGGRIKTVLKF